MELIASGAAFVLISAAAIGLSAGLRRLSPGRWSGQDGAFVILIMVTMSIGAAVLAVRVATGSWDGSSEESLGAAVVGTAAGGGVAVACALARAGLGGLGLRTAGKRIWALLPAVALLFFVFSALWGAATQALGAGEDPQQLLELIGQRWPEPEAVLVVVYGVLVAPLFEEVIFRGFLLPPAVRRLGARGGILLTAGLFGLMHLSDPAAVPPLVFLGVLLAWTRLRSGSLWPAIVLHMGNNILAVGMLIWTADNGLASGHGDAVRAAWTQPLFCIAHCPASPGDMCLLWGHF